MRKDKTIWALMGLLVFVLCVFFVAGAGAQDGSSIGKRMYNDERVPETTVNNKLIMRKKYAPRKVRPVEAQGSAQEETAQEVPEENAADEAMTQGIEETRADGQEKAMREIEPLSAQEQREIKRRAQGESPENEEDRKDEQDENKVTPQQQRSVERANNIACKSLCETVEDPGCYEQCAQAGICATGFVECKQ